MALSADGAQQQQQYLQSAPSAAHVLYVDHCGHPAPLQECYHATASRRLSSSVERHPPSTVLEVDSAYCPQCLSYHDVTSLARLGYCPKPTCRYCPVCLSVAAATADEEQGEDGTRCYYRCGQCDWTSLECGLAVTVGSATGGGSGGDGGGGIGKLEISRALEELGSEWDRRRREQREPAEAYFQSLTQAWEQKARNEGTLGNLFLGGGNNYGKSAADDGPEGWSVEALEASMQDRKKQLAAVPSLEGTKVKRISLDDGAPSLALTDPGNGECSLSTVPTTAFQLQALNGSQLPRSRKDLLPLPIPLRPRKSRRCRAELAEGRPGILLKPKLNPLEGDTSQRTGQGQWWKKDSSAVHVLPKVRVVRHAAVATGEAEGDGQRQRHRVFLLKVTNPTLGLVRLRLTASEYKGEPEWDVDTGGSSRTTPDMPDLLVDAFSRRRWNLSLQQLPAALPATETVELLSAEDSFIELRGKAPEIPQAVAQWEPAAPLLDADAAANANTMGLVAASASTAWFQVAVAIAPGSGGGGCVVPSSSLNSEADAPVARAVPLALQIEVGQGSWESSLIQPKAPAEGQDRDWVTFDLVLAWTDGKE